MGRSPREKSAALVGIEVRTDSAGRKRYRGTVYDKLRKGHQHGPWVSNLAEARAWRVDAQGAMRSGGTVARVGTLREGMAGFLAGMGSGEILNRSGQRYKPSVCRSYAGAYQRYLDPFLGGAQVGDIRRKDLQEVVDRLKISHSPSTVRNALMPLRAYYRWALVRDRVPANPTLGVEIPASRGRRDRVATPVEAARLIGVLPPDDQAVWSSFFYAGLRVGEAQGLMIEDIDLDQKVIRVCRSWDRVEGEIAPKSAAGVRMVPIPRALSTTLASVLARCRWSKGLLFGRTPETAFTPQSLTQRADRIWKSNDLRRITPHEARHTYASLMIDAMKNDQTLNVKVLSTIMGHASITETYDRYGHLLPGSEMAAVAALDALLDDVPRPVPTA